jgi:hypothetical protein
MGFTGYVAVCVQLYCRCFTVLNLVERQQKRKASRQTHTHTHTHTYKNQKINEKKTQQKNTNGNVQEKATKNSEADSFRNIKVKHHTHLNMAM